MIHPEKRRENRKILERAMDFDEQKEPSPARKEEIKREIKKALEKNPAWLYRQYACIPSRTMDLTPYQAELLIGLLEDNINDEDFKYAYNEKERSALKEIYEKYKHFGAYG